MNNLKSIKKFICCRCINEIDIMTSEEPKPLYLCDTCIQDEIYKHRILVEIQGAPAGYVRGSENRCRNKLDGKVFRESLPGSKES